MLGKLIYLGRVGSGAEDPRAVSGFGSGMFDALVRILNKNLPYYQQIIPGNYKFTNKYCGSGSGIRCLLTLDPGSGVAKKARFGSGMNILDHISESLETVF